VSRIVSWFSCGAASAAATRLALTAARAAGDEIVVARIVVPEEDGDNGRFALDCEDWFGVPVLNLRSAEYASCEDLWGARKYMAGAAGAICTTEMKKAVRWAFEKDWQPTHQVFGFTADKRELQRAERFREQNPEVRLRVPLIDGGLTKADCYALVQRAGLNLPRMYALGYDNANCVGCVKAQSPRYWNRVRLTHPEVFHRRAVQSRRLGVKLVKGTRGARGRMFLDELDPADVSEADAPPTDCSIACTFAEDTIARRNPAEDLL